MRGDQLAILDFCPIKPVEEKRYLAIKQMERYVYE
jgi:hypothetical protein